MYDSFDNTYQVRFLFVQDQVASTHKMNDDYQIILFTGNYRNRFFIENHVFRGSDCEASVMGKNIV